MDSGVAVAIMRSISEVVWHAGIITAPLKLLYDTVLGSLDRSSGGPVVILRPRNKVYLSSRALLNLAIQRKYISDEPDKAVFKSISSRHSIMGSKHYGGDLDLEATLGIVDRVFGDFELMYWQNFSFAISHHAWMSHTFLYRAWGVLRKGEHFSEEFILYSLRLESPLPAPIVAGCLFISLVLGIGLCADDQLVVDGG